MGSGTSKENAVNTFEISDDEGDQWVSKPIEKKPEKKESVIGRVFGKSKAKTATNLSKARTVVDLNSSDSEEEYFKVKAKDTELKKEISSLEKTLNSLGLDKRGRQVRVKENNVKDDNHVDDRPLGYSSDSDGYMTRVGDTKVQTRSHRKTRDLKFSWDEKQGGKQTEEWTVSKLKIEGFDPEKFKAANTVQSRGTPGLVIVQKRQSSGSLLPPNTPPGCVPAYSPLEQQLLASIEQELGV